MDKYMEKPDRYVSWVLGYEGKGSLVQYLRKRYSLVGEVKGKQLLQPTLFQGVGTGVVRWK
jgi:secreted Zn-dependent insulinase-like peptidase